MYKSHDASVFSTLAGIQMARQTFECVGGHFTLTLQFCTFVLSIVKLRKSNFEHTYPSLQNIKSAPVSGETPGGTPISKGRGCSSSRLGV